MQNLPWLRNKEYPLLLLPVRETLERIGLPYVLENVMGARHGSKGLTKRGLEAHGLQAGYLCGTMFQKSFYRHRLFAANWLWLAPGHPKHTVYDPAKMTVHRAIKEMPLVVPGHNNPVNTAWRQYHDGAQAAGVGVGHAKGWRLAAEAMNISWMNRTELTQAIPPVFSRHIGEQLLRVLA